MTDRPSDLVQDNLPGEEPRVPESTDSGAAPAAGWKVTEADIREAMKDVVDPELMVNVVDLGLLYDIHLDPDGVNCVLDMTLTTPTCPMTDRLEYDTKMVLQGLVPNPIINWVWMPPWSLEMITEDGREQLRAVGFSI